MHYHVQLKQQANQEIKYFSEFCNSIKDQTVNQRDIEKPKSLIEVKIAPLKGDERAIEKITGKYKGKSQKVIDMVRGSLIFDNFEDLQNAKSNIEECISGKVKIKDRFANPTSMGYKDIILSFQDEKTGHVVEIQLHLREMYLAKQEAHTLYEGARSIESTAAIEQRPLNLEEAKEISDLSKQFKQIYSDASAHYPELSEAENTEELTSNRNLAK